VAANEPSPRPDEAERRAAVVRAVLEDAPVALVAVDLDGRVTFWNPEAERLFGWRAAEVLGRATPIIRDEDRLEFEQLLRGGKAGDVPRPTEGYRRCKDGREIQVSGARALLRDAAGHPVGVLGMLSNASEQARCEHNFRTVIERTPDGVAVYQGDALLYVNPQLLTMLGHDSAAELLGRSPLEFVHADDRAMVMERILTYSRRGLETPPIEERFLRRDGSALPVEVTSIPIFWDDTPATLVHARDLTERKALEAQVVLADRLASVGRLAATVGHEINNPLAFVLANLEMSLERLGGGGIDAERAADIAEMLREAREGAERVRTIVRDLKVFSRGESEERASVDPRRVLDSCVSMARGEIRHRARLEKRYAPTPAVRVNESRLGQVLLNLLVNAAHAIPEESPEEHLITVSTGTDAQGRVVIEVSDTGTGMTDEVRRRIFEPFFTTKPGGVGTGLGLSICQSIVTALGGEITVESALGRGSTFRVCLPPAPDSEPPPISRLP
jgi:PAS domain S-box-containing protein